MLYRDVVFAGFFQPRDLRLMITDARAAMSALGFSLMEL
jgi:hypothetical protein